MIVASVQWFTRTASLFLSVVLEFKKWFPAMVRHENRRDPVFLSIVTWASNSLPIDSRHWQDVIRWPVTSIVSIVSVRLTAVLPFLRLARQRDRF